MRGDEFSLTTSGVVKRLRDRWGVERTPDTIRLWVRRGRLTVYELENGQRTYRPRDVDALGERLAREQDSHVA